MLDFLEHFFEVIKAIISFRLINYGAAEHHIELSIGALILFVLIFRVSTYLMKLCQKLIIPQFQESDQLKIKSVFYFLKYFVYTIVVFVAMDSIGINLTALFAASAALLVGVGLALQTLIQDIISGIFIFIDQTVHVGDVIEIEGKIGRVEEITLRTTRAVTIENKVMVIPNHKYLTSTLFNWTQNGKLTREVINVGVGYGSNIKEVEKQLIQAANSIETVLDFPQPRVLFVNFGDSALEFELYFSVKRSFYNERIKSDIRFEIHRLFKKHNIEIPFPQRVVTMVNHD